MSENIKKQIKINRINKTKQNKEKGLKTSLIRRKLKRRPPSVNFCNQLQGWKYSNVPAKKRNKSVKHAKIKMQTKNKNKN